MTSSVYCNRVVPRNASSQSTHCWFNAWHTCSSVTSAFFPPQPGCLTGGKGQRHQTQDHVPHQRHVMPPLEVAEADLPLAGAEAVLHVPATEPHTQHSPQRRRGRL